MIQTDRLVLREPRLGDAEPLMAIFGDPVAMQYIGEGGPRTLEQVRASLTKRIDQLASSGFTLWTVETHAGDILGDCGVLPAAWTGPDLELAYRYKPAAWGNGFATEAARAAMHHIQQTTGVHEVLGLTDLRNAASQRVLTNVGFTELGTTDRYYNETLSHFIWRRPA